MIPDNIAQLKPSGYDHFMAHVMADRHPAVCLVDRDLLRQLGAYVDALEHEVASQGSFY